MESKIIVAVFIAICIVPAFPAPASRTIEIAHKNMPQEIQQTFPSLVEITEKLTKLYAGEKPMKLTADVFKTASVLESIDLSDGEVSEIEDGAFYGPAKLKKLNLSGNNLRKLPRDLFPKNNAISEIDLSNNQIEALSRSTFKNLQHLRKLDLSNNQLTELDGSIFADMIHLQELDLTGNPIGSISEEFFASLPQGLQLSFDDQTLDLKSQELAEQWSL